MHTYAHKWKLSACGSLPFFSFKYHHRKKYKNSRLHKAEGIKKKKGEMQTTQLCRLIIFSCASIFFFFFS